MQQIQHSQSDGDGAAVHAAAGEAKAKAGDVAQEAQQKAQRTAAQVQDKMREQIDERSSQVASQITEQVSDLRSVSESLRGEGKDGPAKAADRLADYAEKVGSYLDAKDSHALLADAEDFGRRQPLALAAGGLALGFAASRFLKASSARRYRGAATAPTTATSGSLPTATPTPAGAPQQPPRLAAPAVQGSMPVV
jgi:hypothetical protein